MAVYSPMERELLRVRLVAVGMLAAFLGLGVFLWRIQIVHGARYETSLSRQSMRRVRIPGLRGRIFDRNGVCLVDNRPSHCIAVYLEELREPGRWSNTVAKVEQTIADLSSIVELEPEVDVADIMEHIRKLLPLPLILWRDVGHTALARLAERAPSMRGVDVYTEAVRVYPLGSLAAHLLGRTVRAAPWRKDEQPYDYYVSEVEGKNGVERRLDDRLAGKPGGLLIRVDVSGFKYNERYVRRSEPGRDVYLTIDSRIQRSAEDALTQETGAVVVLDVWNGEVLALASAPAFDPNVFVPAISQRAWAALLNDSRHPLLNRAVAGSYAPGSTFKPVVALAALENRKVAWDVTYECTGVLRLGGLDFGCWETRGHGPMDVRSALAQSCNVFFYELALDTGYEYIYHMALALGFGRKTGIELDYEVPGILADGAWTLRKRGHPWRPGDTCNASIGQGYLTVTPLQMAVMTAAIANGGSVYRPRLVRAMGQAGSEQLAPVPGLPPKNMNWSPRTLQLVRGGMRDVVHGVKGTAPAARVPGLTLAAKTGTAEYGAKGSGLNRGWMIAFFPFEAPRYAVAMVLDNVESASHSVAPRLRRLVEGILGSGGGRDT